MDYLFSLSRVQIAQGVMCVLLIQAIEFIWVRSPLYSAHLRRLFLLACILLVIGEAWTGIVWMAKFREFFGIGRDNR